MAEQKFPNGVHRHFEGLVFGVAICPGGDEGEGHRLATILHRQLQRGTVGGNQQFPLPVISTPPDWAYRVNHVLSRQTVALGDLGLACGATAQGAALLQQLRPGGAVDGSVHAAPAQQAIFGGVDNGIHLHGGNIIAYHL